MLVRHAQYMLDPAAPAPTPAIHCEIASVLMHHRLKHIHWNCARVQEVVEAAPTPAAVLTGLPAASPAHRCGDVAAASRRNGAPQASALAALAALVRRGVAAAQRCATAVAAWAGAWMPGDLIELGLCRSRGRNSRRSCVHRQAAPGGLHS
jgi:hypothetical protein